MRSDERGKRRSERERGRDEKPDVDRASNGEGQGADGACSDGEISHAQLTKIVFVRSLNGKGGGERRAKRGRRAWCSQDVADTSGKSQALTEAGFEMSSFGFTAIDSAADNMKSASLVFAISMVPRSTSWNLSCCRPRSW